MGDPVTVEEVEAVTLPHRLRSVRTRARLTQGQIARWAGVSRCHVSNVEAGRDPAPDALLVVYARRCKLGWLGLAKLRELRAGSPLPPDLVVAFEFELPAAEAESGS